jgi:hypothetical protein
MKSSRFAAADATVTMSAVGLCTSAVVGCTMVLAMLLWLSPADRSTKLPCVHAAAAAAAAVTAVAAASVAAAAVTAAAAAAPAGVWTNTCCSHPLYGQDPNEIDSDDDIASGAVPGAKAAAVRKLAHELGENSHLCVCVCVCVCGGVLGPIPAPSLPYRCNQLLAALQWPNLW